MTEDRKKKMLVGALQMRTEDNYWTATYVLPGFDGNGETKVLLATLHMRHAEDEHRKKQFMELVSGCVADFIEGVLGTRPDMDKIVPGGMGLPGNDP